MMDNQKNINIQDTVNVNDIEEKSKRGRPRSKTGNCVICRHCRENPRFDEIVHKIKFEESLTLDQLAEKIFNEFGLKFHYNYFYYHYLHHMDAEKTELFKAQCILNKRRSLVGRRGRKKKSEIDDSDDTDFSKEVVSLVPVNRYSFDVLNNLKTFYFELVSKFDSMRKQQNLTELTTENLKLFKSIIEELRKLAGDIVKIEQGSFVIKDVIKGILRKVLKNLVRDFANLAGMAYLDDDLKAKLIVQMKKDIEKSLDEIDKEFKRRTL